MIGLLRGGVLHREGSRALVDVQGVGYAVSATARDLDRWEGEEQATVFVSTQVREDSITLYGFASPEDQRAFEILLGVSGVGPKLALAALDTLALSELRRAIEADDIRTLQSISGVGKRTAQRMALDLKGKLPAPFGPTATQGTASSAGAAPLAGPDAFAMALEKLGYGKAEIEAARGRVEAAGLSEAPVGERLRVALKTAYTPR